MQKKVLEFMEQYHMAEEGERILAAVSGGADSVCLLLVIVRIAERKEISAFLWYM